MKGPGDPVTEADLLSQESIASDILGAFPDHTMLAEEDGLAPDPGRAARWIVDPLDGTINYAHGIPIWCISIALEFDGELVAGVIFHPPLGLLYRAMKGAGAFLNDQPIQVSRASRLSDCLIATGMPTAFLADRERQLALMGRFSSDTHSVRRTGSSAWNLALLAAGAIDVCYSTALHPWDAAAGVVLVREAGGCVSGLSGEPYDHYNHQILATNDIVHQQALAAIHEAWPALGRPMASKPAN
jgi:myo-inositol-1(or 4)-monophosphatase